MIADVRHDLAENFFGFNGGKGIDNSFDGCQ
jgi:hypothetical protein